MEWIVIFEQCRVSSSLYFWKIELGLGKRQYTLQKRIAFTYIPKPENDSTLFTVFTHTHTYIYIYIYSQLATSFGAMDSEDEGLEVDPGVPWDHGEEDSDQEELLATWPDFETWRPSWVGMSPSTIAHQIEQRAIQRRDQKVLYRIRHNKAFKVRCSNQLHLDQLLEKIRITGGNDAMQPEKQPENESESSDDDFW